MDDNNRSNEITYADGWQSVTTPEYPRTVDPELDNNLQAENVEAVSEKPKKKRHRPRQLLIIIQLIMCLIICLCAFALKNYGGDLYKTVHTWYETELNNELISDGKLNSIDFSDLLKNSATADEA